LPNSALKTAPAKSLAEPEVSPNVEMYLKSIVRLRDGNAPVSTTAIAQELAVSAASASAMLKRLDADGYVTHEGRHGVFPTAKGARVGALTLRRQRLAERLLVDCLGISWEHASAEACRLEHAISPLVEQHLAQFIGHPDTCPHGHPIRVGERIAGVPLADCSPGAKVKILRLENEAEDLLHYLKDAGIEPGLEGEVASNDGEFVSVASDGTMATVTASVAETVSVLADPSPPPRIALPEQLVLGRERYGR